MEAAIKKQMHTAGLIERFWDNLVKAGKEKITHNYLKTRLELLESYWSKYTEAHDALLICDKIEETVYLKENRYAFTEETYLTTKTRILNSLPPSKPESSPRASDASTVLRQIQLPRINLPTFSGDQLAWESFRDLFRSLVHDAEGLASIQKLQYLKSSLSGEAATLISSIEMTSEGYESAWDELVTRYDNKRVLLASHMRALISCAPIAKASGAEINRLVSAVNQATRSFRSLKRPVEHWDDWFVHILVEKLDSSTRLLWESSHKTTQQIPTFEELKVFLLTRVRALEAAQPRPTASSISSKGSKQGGRRNEVSSHSTTTASASLCSLCKGQHSLRSCNKFKACPVEQRREHVRKTRVCYNCLGLNHTSGTCPSTNRCRHCNNKHHSLLHIDGDPTISQPLAQDLHAPDKPTNKVDVAGEATRVVALSSTTSSTVLLATALVTLYSDSGCSITARALLDSGSESSFVSERVAQQLRLRRRRVNMKVNGLQNVTTGKASHAVSLMVGCQRSPTLRIALPNALVFPKLTQTPRTQVPRGDWPHLRGLQLADPNFDSPAAVDAILGADIYGMLIEGGIKRGSSEEPSALNTVFGWVLVGPRSDASAFPPSVASHCMTIEPDLQQELQRFWSLEEIPSERILSPDDEYCEQLFTTSHTRDLQGRYTVRLPTRRDQLAGLGDSRQGALRLFLNNENRLARNPPLRQAYSDFMTSYHSLGHMEILTKSEPNTGSYYLPHHAVVKKSDPGEKIRVVFNASFRTSSGLSLNDILLPGPKLQADLWLVLTRWRLHQFAFITDIVKMFRQIRVHKDDADLQRILWRADPAEEIQDCRLLTITYGTAPAPYLALRTIFQLAHDEEHRFPKGAAALRFNSYVDDILAGANTLEEALEIKSQLESLLQAGGFQLSKWAGTHSALCPEGNQAVRFISDADCVGALGVIWLPDSDTLSMRTVPALKTSAEPTKRSVLSTVAKLFDPAGWAAPVVVTGKLFIQDLWMTGLEWDQPLPPELQDRWLRFAFQLPELNQVRIPRWTGIRSSYELHVFSDASERAYAASLYLRGLGSPGYYKASLLIAKTKIAPIKPMSIPRLELCGALLAARLLRRMATELAINHDNMHAWTDAQVVLAWIRAHPSRWSNFVRNRVAAVQELVPPDRWHYVPTRENPADLATRGLSPSALEHSTLWWNGPEWLTHSSEPWAGEEIAIPDVNEERRHHAPTVNLQTTIDRSDPENELLSRFSSFNRLIRVSAYCLRFLRAIPRPGTSFLCADELARCHLRWLTIAQRQNFEEELKLLKSGKPLFRRSSLLMLRPFIAQDGLLRVGGRLGHSPLTFEEKHPIILAKDNHLSRLLVLDAHVRTLHGGPQLTRSVIVRRYWILRAASLIKSVIHNCVRCVRLRGSTAQQQMGHLPRDRVKISRPFSSSGVDYAGPIHLRASKGRGQKSFKGYICLFVCMSTKAVHLEAVSDLTSGAFLAAFARFVARRGHCARLLSDNGTNFRGADKELRDMFQAASNFYRGCRQDLARDGTEWSFIPPSAPHFGGLWEAGVKATKYHLRRVLGDQLLTFEELSTLLCKIEACLNSRPLYPLSKDPADFAAITPGHLLIGESPINLPEPPSPDKSCGPTSPRYRLITHVRDHFWRRWSQEYIQHLQQLSKWKRRAVNLQTGTLVLIKDEQRPPAKWSLGRIHDVHPGNDGLVRVVTVDTANSRLRRPIAKICPLPINSEELEDEANI